MSGCFNIFACLDNLLISFPSSPQAKLLESSHHWMGTSMAGQYLCDASSSVCPSLPPLGPHRPLAGHATTHSPLLLSLLKTSLALSTFTENFGPIISSHFGEPTNQKWPVCLGVVCHFLLFILAVKWTEVKTKSWTVNCNLMWPRCASPGGTAM